MAQRQGENSVVKVRKWGERSQNGMDRSRLEMIPTTGQVWQESVNRVHLWAGYEQRRGYLSPLPGSEHLGDVLGLTQVLGARLTVVNAPGQAGPSAADLLRPEPGQRGRTLWGSVG